MIETQTNNLRLFMHDVKSLSEKNIIENLMKLPRECHDPKVNLPEEANEEVLGNKQLQCRTAQLQ